MIKDKQAEPRPIVLIRHGESEYNDQAQKLRRKLGIGATWQQYRASPQFLKFKYSDQMLDCRLSAKGRQQCGDLSYQFQKQVNHKLFDLILVSPLFRALESCSLIFAHIIEVNQQICKGITNCHEQEGYTPIIVEPILAESLRCACDVSFKLPQAKQEFPYFDYSLINGKESEWYIQNQVPSRRDSYKKMLELNNVKGYLQTALFLNKYMGETYDFESGLDLMSRARRARTKIKQYQLKYQRIAVVSHFYLIGYISTEDSQFNEHGKPLTKFNVPNAHPIEYSLPAQLPDCL